MNNKLRSQDWFGKSDKWDLYTAPGCATRTTPMIISGSNPLLEFAIPGVTPSLRDFAKIIFALK